MGTRWSTKIQCIIIDFTVGPEPTNLNKSKANLLLFFSINTFGTSSNPVKGS